MSRGRSSSSQLSTARRPCSSPSSPQRHTDPERLYHRAAKEGEWPSTFSACATMSCANTANMWKASFTSATSVSSASSRIRWRGVSSGQTRYCKLNPAYEPAGTPADLAADGLILNAVDAKRLLRCAPGLRRSFRSAAYQHHGAVTARHFRVDPVED